MHCANIFLAFLLLITGVQARSDNAVRAVDDTGKTVSLPAPAQRIVSLAPHATELLFAAGAGDRVVGVVDYSNYPPAATQLPIVGGYESLNTEAILALQPDLLVAWHSGNSVTQVERLARLGIPVFYTEPRQLEDIATNLERLGRLSGTLTQANAAAADFRERLDALEKRYAGQAAVQTFYQIWNQPLMTVNGEHLISQVISLCGGRNVFADLETLAATIDTEAVLQANPDVIIASGMAVQRPEWLYDWKKWPQLTAAHLDQLYFIEPDLIQRHTPRILDAADIMCKQLDGARARLHRDP